MGSIVFFWGYDNVRSAWYVLERVLQATSFAQEVS